MKSTEIYHVPPGTEILLKHDLKDHVHQIIELPSSLQIIEEGSFAYGNEPMKIQFEGNSVFSFRDHFLTEKSSGKMLTYSGNENLIQVPESVHSISSWAFYECAPDRIIFPDEIPEIHHDAVTTCRVKEAVFSFQNAHVFFPIKDIRMRQYMLEGFGMNGMFDFQRYDEALSAGYIEPERIREITARLKWPYALSSENMNLFSRTVQNHLREIVTVLGKAKDFNTLHWLSDLNFINEKNQEEVLKTLHLLPDLDAYMDLSRYLHETQKNSTYDFSI